MNASIVPTATVAFALVLIGSTARPASAQLMTKPQVANLIKNVENGVDEFRDYLEKIRAVVRVELAASIPLVECCDRATT
jgi:hypothetical protein